MHFRLSTALSVPFCDFLGKIFVFNKIVSTFRKIFAYLFVEMLRNFQTKFALFYGVVSFGLAGRFAINRRAIPGASPHRTVTIWGKSPDGSERFYRSCYILLKRL